MSSSPRVEDTSDVKPGSWSAPGFLYPGRVVLHDKQWQTERLASSDVSPANYGDIAETGLFGLDCFDSMVHVGHDIDGYIFFDQQFLLKRSPKLGESLVLSGEIEKLDPVPRGLFADEVYRFHDLKGSLCIETRIRGIVEPLPDGVDATRVRRLPARAVVPADGWNLLESKEVTPSKVRRFSEDVGNDLHFDPAAARAYGFRAPLAQGVMSAVYLLGALARTRPPARLDVVVEYLRPVFWDSPVTLWLRESAAGHEHPVMVQSRNDEGKATANLIVRSVSY